MSSHEKLGDFLREVSNWNWQDFVLAENDPNYSSNEAIIFALIRSCAMQKMEAIRVSINRLDGKLKTPIIVEYPKMYFLYPNAKIVATDDSIIDDKPLTVSGIVLATTSGPPYAPGEPHEETEDVTDLPSLSLRETLTKMADFPRATPEALVNRALEVEQYMNAKKPFPFPPDDIPLVKSVVAAHLLTMAANRNMAAASEVFDQIDGKLAETIQILGEDVHIVNYSTIAPAGATYNEDGVLQVEAIQTTNLWADKLKEYAKL